MTIKTSRTKKWPRVLAVITALAVLAIGTFAYINRVSPLSLRLWGDTYYAQQPVAMNGYDPVAYQTTGTAMRGDASHTFRWADSNWNFVSEENKALFAANPEKYAPQYGGYCAFAASKGFTAASSPTAWHVDDGKLYVFADEKVRDAWVSTDARQLSDENWAKH